ncbi:right-handed parallel beta-helix repeat-containing protein [Kineococcus sp. SYSU DK004]|uniref:right-handed parallel beta-helix repeat-containing protein n=1 Tax=Kineococcus sp. SYSU DK004 TaxID=3383125 RepID=UPI003D7CF33B
MRHATSRTPHARTPGGLRRRMPLTAAPALAVALAAASAGAAPAVAAPAAGAPTWSAVTFGQSTDLDFASNVLPEKVGVNRAEPEVPGTVEGDVVLESRGGKIAPGHDGLTSYRVELDPREHNFVLEADVTVEQFGPETGAAPAGQEAAGLMVRDVDGAPRQDPQQEGFEEVPAASNTAGIAVMRGGVTSLSRTGVTQPWGNPGSRWEATPLVKDAGWEPLVGQPVRMRLERTDDAFVVSASSPLLPGGSVERVLPGADRVQVLDEGSMTVGFFAARNATVRVSDVSLTLSPADTQPHVEPPAPAPAPAVELVSAPHAGSAEHVVRARATRDGRLSVTAAGRTVLDGAAVRAGEPVEVPVRLGAATTEVVATLVPDGGAPVTATQSVRLREFTRAGAELVVAADGTPAGDGTRGAPLDLTTALQFALPGQAVVMRGGTYPLERTVTVAAPYSGTEEAPKTLRPAEGEEVVWDGERASGPAFRLDADHWQVQDFRVTRGGSNGMRVSGSHNVVERMVFNFNRDTGFQMSGSGSDPARWPSHNLVLDSESHDNRDAGDINADGFAAKLGVGEGNVFRGNVAHHNIDDGWDLYNRTNEGANAPIRLEGNIAHSNGRLSDGYGADSNTGNGFKLGGEGLPVAHVVVGNLAFGNNMDGFTDNFNPGRLEVRGNTSADNKRFNYLVRTNPYVAEADQGTYRDNLSLRTRAGGRDDSIAGDVDGTNFLVVDGRTVGGGGLSPTAWDFSSLTPPARYERARDGSIVWGDYTRLLQRSKLTRAGTDRGHVGVLGPQPGRPGDGPGKRP